MLALGVPALAIGMGWTTQPLGSLPAKKTIVFAVSCARPGHCAVVGGTLRRGKAGTEWHQHRRRGDVVRITLLGLGRA